MTSCRKKLCSRSDCRGATVVEFALTAPILFMLVLASVEFSRANVLINSAKIATSEGARRGIVLGTTAEQIESVIRNELATVGAAYADIQVNPSVVDDDTEIVTVGVSVPLDLRNGYITPKYFLGDYVWKVTAIPREAVVDSNMTQRLKAAFNSMKDKLKKNQASEQGQINGRGT